MLLGMASCGNSPDTGIRDTEYSAQVIFHMAASGQSSIMPDLLIDFGGADELDAPKLCGKTAR